MKCFDCKNRSVFPNKVCPLCRDYDRYEPKPTTNEEGGRVIGKYDDLVRRLNNRRICIQKTGNLNDFPLLQEASVAIKLLEQENEWLREELNKRLQIENSDEIKKGD